MQRNSVKRDAILKKICSTKSHPTAELVYSELKSEFPDLSFAIYAGRAERMNLSVHGTCKKYEVRHN